MADERGATIIGDRVETRLDQISADVSELKGTVSQMDKRLSSLEATVRQEIGDLRKDNKQTFFWLLGIMLTTWMGTIWAILSKIR